MTVIYWVVGFLIAVIVDSTFLSSTTFITKVSTLGFCSTVTLLNSMLWELNVDNSEIFCFMAINSALTNFYWVTSVTIDWIYLIGTLYTCDFVDWVLKSEMTAYWVVLSKVTLVSITYVPFLIIIVYSLAFLNSLTTTELTSAVLNDEISSLMVSTTLTYSALVFSMVLMSLVVITFLLNSS